MPPQALRFSRVIANAEPGVPRMQTVPQLRTATAVLDSQGSAGIHGKGADGLAGLAVAKAARGQKKGSAQPSASEAKKRSIRLLSVCVRSSFRMLRRPCPLGGKSRILGWYRPKL